MCFQYCPGICKSIRTAKSTQEKLSPENLNQQNQLRKKVSILSKKEIKQTLNDEADQINVSAVEMATLQTHPNPIIRHSKAHLNSYVSMVKFALQMYWVVEVVRCSKRMNQWWMLVPNSTSLCLLDYLKT